MSEIEENGGAVFDEWRSTNVVFQLNDLIDDDDEKVGEENGGGVYVNCVDSIMEEGLTQGNVRKKGSIAERRAATCGFNASRINVARFRSGSPLSSPVVQSPYLTIPSGISPTALLDSPIMLPNSQLSPTTGTFPLTPLNHGSSVWISASPASVGERDIDSSYMFQPHEGPFSWLCNSELQNQPVMSSELPVELLKEPATKNSATDSSGEAKVLANTIPNTCSVFEGYPKEMHPLTGIVKNPEDGYNWRKYGQKHVKGSEYPRSYYKCTHPNCLVKKKVERSLDGQITEIIFKGAHNHQIPHPSHLTAGASASFSDMSEIGQGNGSCINVESGDILRNMQLDSEDMKDGSERSSSTSVQTDNSDPFSSTQGKSVGIFESAGIPEFSSTLGEDDDDGVNEGKLSPGDDADDDRSESKRRKKGNFLMETSMVSRAMREPRVVVQIESEIDILDDGYRWRKYGQKVVKGNPNPRSYYKCTSPGCLVRKHVERASDNPKAVITTYEGKHNHEVSASRNSKNSNLDVGNSPLNVSNRPRITGISKLDTQFQDHPFNFERKLGSEYLLPSFVGHFGDNMKFGGYQPKFVPSDKSISFVLPDFPMSLPMSIPGSAKTVQGNFQVQPIDQSCSFVGGQDFRDNNARILRPKQEQHDNMFDPQLPIEDHANAVIPNFPS